jgi:methylenetetrahydrofolate dehydrogenase (NADP+)/methenyltetrahydrofolate cyclohydrolase
MAKLLMGKEVSKKIIQDLKQEVEKLKYERNIVPGLAVIMVGNDPASRIYVKKKEDACHELSINSKKFELSEETSQTEVLELIDKLNEDEKIHGILVQLPLPKHLNEKIIISKISPKKDVDAFHPINVGKIMIGNFEFAPCTPAGIMELIKESKVDVCGKECVVVGRSNIVGKPLAMLLLRQNATVTICHSKTVNLKSVTKRADILVVAIGKPKFITFDMVKKGAIVIDVGINRNEDGKIIGDVNFDEVSCIASVITPVPGGVGPMTISLLMKNTIIAAKNS